MIRQASEILYGNDDEMPSTSHVVALERWGPWYVTRHVVAVFPPPSSGWKAVMVTTGVN